MMSDSFEEKNFRLRINLMLINAVRKVQVIEWPIERARIRNRY
jgi:hypothetical protein